MKKILATVLALTMIVGMSITVFAAKESFDEVGVTSSAITVNGTYGKSTTTTDESPVYSVDIEWSEISFHYQESANVKTWDPSELAYVENTRDGGVWSGNDVVITITNSSNAGVVVTPNWSKAANGADVVVSGAVTLGTAVGAGEGGVNAATTGTITVSKPVSGAISAEGALGTLTLTITGELQ